MSYLETLRRIPDDIFLAIFAQDFDEHNGERCICGWAMREALARASNTAPEKQRAYDREALRLHTGEPWTPPERCVVTFGGTSEEWGNLYGGAEFHVSNVEEAVVDRLNEIVSV